MNIDDLLHNWRRWHARDISAHLTHLYYERQCGSAEKAYVSIKDAGWGNEELGEADPAIDRISKPPIDETNAKRVDQAYNELHDKYKHVIRAEYLPWMEFDPQLNPKRRPRPIYLQLLTSAKGQIVFKLGVI